MHTTHTYSPSPLLSAQCSLPPTAPPLPPIHTPAMSVNCFCHAGPPPPYTYPSPLTYPPLTYPSPLKPHLCHPQQQPLYFQGGGDAYGHCEWQLQQVQMRLAQEQVRLVQNQSHQQAHGTGGRDGPNSSLAAGAAGALRGGKLGLGLTGVVAVRFPPLRRGRGGGGGQG